MNFTKMHGLGNDFVVLDNTTNQIDLTKININGLAHRNFGIGFDQMLVVEKSNLQGIDFKYLIFNADGSQVEQCGNGARCFARFVYENKLTDKKNIKVETLSGVISLTINDDKSVSVDMGVADFNPQTIIKKPVKLDNYIIANQQMGLVSMGNPHAVILVDDIDDNIEKIAKQVQNSVEFVNGVNVGFMQILAKNHIKLRVYERGSGETLACGSGACAAVSYGIKQGMLANKVKVSLKGGNCFIEKINNQVILIGPAEFVFTGKI